MNLHGLQQSGFVAGESLPTSGSFGTARRRRLLGGICFAALALSSHGALAAVPSNEPPPEETAALTPRPKTTGFRIMRSPGVSVSLGPYGGLALLDTQRAADAHLIAGAVGRFRIGYVELGGQIESSDRVEEKWRLLGGFVGGFIPYENWVDFEFAVGAGLRRYLNPDQRYGAGGYDIKSPVITLRAGLSDRLGKGIFGLRLGAELLVGFDLKRDSATWTYTYTDTDEGTVVETGTTPVGGTSIALALSISLDIATGAKR